LIDDDEKNVLGCGCLFLHGAEITRRL
jgi:hypothetical protein